MKDTYIKVSDDWFPNYSDDTVLLKINDCPFHGQYGDLYIPDYIRVIVEGEDDFLMFKGFFYDSQESKIVAEKEATELYNRILENIPFSQELAKKFGLKIF